MSIEGKEDIEKLVTQYKGSVFDETKIGCMKVPPVHLDYETDFKPRQPPNLSGIYRSSTRRESAIYCNF